MKVGSIDVDVASLSFLLAVIMIVAMLLVIGVLMVIVIMIVFMTVSMIVSMMVIMASSKMVVSITLVKNLHLNEVEEESSDGGYHHYLGINLNWSDNSIGGLYDEPNCKSNQKRDTYQSTDDFSSMPSESKFVRSWAHADFESDHRHCETNHI